MNLAFSFLLLFVSFSEDIALGNYLDHFCGDYKRCQQRTNRHAPAAVKHALTYGLDPMLVLTTIARETSFMSSAKGEKGEIGLMQCNPKSKCGKGFDLKVPEQQIEAGIIWLKQSIDSCGGSVLKGLNNWGTGRCVTPKMEFGKKRLRYYKRMKKKFYIFKRRGYESSTMEQKRQNRN